MVFGLFLWLGWQPFADGVRQVRAETALLAVGLTFFTTCCSAWRWRAVASALGAAPGLWWSVAACYRSQLLNSVLPGGVLGDVNRAVESGAATREFSLMARAVFWERLGGLAVALTAALLAGLILIPPPQWWLPFGIAMVACGFGWWLLARRLTWTRRLNAAIAKDGAKLWSQAGIAIVCASLLATSGYVGLFLVAAHATANNASWPTLIGLGLVVLAGSAIPLSFAGWGPREGTAAASFVAVGFSAQEGVTVSVTYGVLSLISLLPGVLAWLWIGSGEAKRD